MVAVIEKESQRHDEKRLRGGGTGSRVLSVLQGKDAVVVVGLRRREAPMIEQILGGRRRSGYSWMEEKLAGWLCVVGGGARRG